MEFHGEFSMEIHGNPWNSMEVFHTGNKKSGSDDMSSETIAVASVEDLSDYCSYLLLG